MYFHSALTAPTTLGHMYHNNFHFTPHLILPLACPVAPLSHQTISERQWYRISEPSASSIENSDSLLNKPRLVQTFGFCQRHHDSLTISLGKILVYGTIMPLSIRPHNHPKTAFRPQPFKNKWRMIIPGK